MIEYLQVELYIKVDSMVPNRSNVAEPMSETLVSIECRRIKRDLIEHRTIDRHSTVFPSDGLYLQGRYYQGLQYL